MEERGLGYPAASSGYQAEGVPPLDQQQGLCQLLLPLQHSPRYEYQL